MSEPRCTCGWQYPSDRAETCRCLMECPDCGHDLAGCAGIAPDGCRGLCAACDAEYARSHPDECPECGELDRRHTAWCLTGMRLRKAAEEKCEQAKRDERENRRAKLRREDPDARAERQEREVSGQLDDAEDENAMREMERDGTPVRERE